MRPWAWVVPEAAGGIRSYSESLWEQLGSKAPEGSRIFFHDDLGEIAALNPGLVHIQHEYGCWGSKTPGRYRFPRWLNEARKALPNAKFIATAHSVIPEDYRYTVSGRGWQVPLRWVANTVAMPFLTRWWNASWGNLDAVIVHSALQIEPVRRGGCPVVREIAHFVPDCEASAGRESEPAAAGSSKVVVFGYFTPDKGQDVAIRALNRLEGSVELILAGGVRTDRDQSYLKECESLVRELGLTSRVKITGFFPGEKLDLIFGEAALVLAPFRYTTGSGSLAQAFARGKAVLASDLPLNREIAERVPGSLAFFRSEDVEDCAREISRLLANAAARDGLARGARDYARKYSMHETVNAHLKLYEEVSSPR